jgi:hypothetical protein
VHRILISIVLCASILFSSCKDSGNQINSINPNGDSELALLMREMYDDALRMKKQIKQGEVPTIIKSFESIHAAKATEPEKASRPDYKLYGDAYLTAMQRIDTFIDWPSKKRAYNSMVESCITCHSSMCPGPIAKINKLKI